MVLLVAHYGSTEKSSWCIYVNDGLPYTNVNNHEQKKKRVKRYLMGQAVSYYCYIQKILIYLKPSHNELEFQVMA